MVSFEDANPERAQRILMALVDTYVQRNIEDALASTNSASDWLRDQTVKLKEELETSEMALHDYKKDKSLLSVSIDDQSNMLRAEMTQLNEDLTRVRAREQAIASRRDELNKIDGKDPSNLPATEPLSSALLQDMRRSTRRRVASETGSSGAGKAQTIRTSRAPPHELRPRRWRCSLR
ncbi:MAG: hypothetical protein IPM35_08865 [Myxococcales bacterium]|nr:hypothetical protein [Myxococcales bacterium]